MLREPINGGAHLVNTPLPTAAKDALNSLTPVVTYLQTLSGQGQSTGKLALSNYVDAVVGYKGTKDYLSDCKTGNASTSAVFKCNLSDLGNPAGMGAALINTLLVTIPTTLLVIVFAALAAYAFAWLDFQRPPMAVCPADWSADRAAANVARPDCPALRQSLASKAPSWGSGFSIPVLDCHMPFT